MQTKIDERLEFIDILKESANLIRRNLNFVVFAFFFSSFPLFCFSVFFELSLQHTFFLASQFLSEKSYPWGYYFLEELPRREFLSESAKAFVSKLIQTCLLYLFPCHLLDLLTTTAIVDAASAVYTSEEQIGLRDLVRKSAQISGKFAGCLITSLFVLAFSTAAIFGFAWVATDYYVASNIFLVDIYHDYFYGYSDPTDLLLHLLIVLFHGALFMVLMAKYSKWSAGWNMALVVSALEEQDVCSPTQLQAMSHGTVVTSYRTKNRYSYHSKDRFPEHTQSVHGVEALELSAYYSRGNERRGLWLMLVFFMPGLVLRLPCLFCKCSEKSIGVLYTCVYAGLICMGNVFKWVACVVYYYDCRSRVLEKKADEEIGRRAKPVPNVKTYFFSDQSLNLEMQNVEN